MSKTYNTDKRRTVNRRDEAEWDHSFSGERFGNQRKQVAELKVRERRAARARDRRDTNLSIKEM